MIQEMLFAPPAIAESAMLPPEPPELTVVAEPMGPCCKAGCSEPATLASPSGKFVYCAEHGKCGHWYMDRQTRCGISVEKFVMHPRLEIYVCPCVGV